ncbi:MAG: 3-deoxy-D-manno-octulosonic acid transferase [Phycisphaerales bacterium]|nr:3-deoxy-D-manno-octulosonic acid transferase [Phycisphaerales bacterium]
MNLLDLAYLPLALITAPFWARKDRQDWPARFGKGDALPTPVRPRVLLHAVSVGEVSALRTLVPLLTPRCEVVIAAGTDTGIARARDLFGGSCEVVRYPVDFSWCVRRLLGRVRPDAVGLVELELWPNFLRACRRRGIPVAVINGRLSARSFKGYRRARPLLRPMFRSLAIACVQDETYARRFSAMGVPPERVRITGTMKWDAASLDVPSGAAQALGAELGIDPARPLIVAGSTGEGEEALVHEAVVVACPPGTQLLCAPRKPERFDEAAASLPGCFRRSARTPAPPGATRFLLDTIGELRLAYALADVVVMGRSFGDLHGSDPIEPGAFGKPVLIGPAFGDFENSVGPLREAGALRVVSATDLPRALAELLADPASARAMGERGCACVRANQGASARHTDVLAGLAGDCCARFPLRQ